MPAIKSIVLIDLETTGLPHQEDFQTQITELAMVACEREHCLTSTSLPRILNKIVLNINPDRKIHPQAASMSGLTNELLENSRPFGEDVVSMMEHFFNRLPKPICLIAHNGIKFDFPILKKQFEKCSKALPNDIYCADSLPAFRKLFPRQQSMSTFKSDAGLRKPANSSFGSEEDDLWCLEAAINVEKMITPDSTPSKVSIQRINETTPQNRIIPNLLERRDRSPEPATPKFNFDAKRKNLMEEFGETRDFDKKSELKENQVPEELKNSKKFCVCPKSHKLQDVYHFLHGESFSDAHRAESDSIALLSCIIKCSDEFFKWLDEEAKLFHETNFPF